MAIRTWHQFWLVPTLVFILPILGLSLVLHRGEPLQPGAEAAIDEASALIRGQALRAPGKDWEALRQAAHASLGRKPSTADLDRALSGLVQALGDPHSQYLPPSTAKALLSSAAPTAAPPASLQSRSGWPVLALSSFNSVNDEAAREAAGLIRRHTEQAIHAQPCGLIVDLRENSGGNMYPMLDGLRPLLGVGALLAFQARDGSRTTVSRDSVAQALGGLDSTAATQPNTEHYRGRIAILIGEHTASSGEMVTLALRSQPNARSFGQRSAGFTTANTVLTLSNGGLLALTVARTLNSQGQPIEGALLPDEALPAGSDAAEVAIRWLSQGCPG